ncbi:MAG: PD-(D/E)XK nuclease family protein [Bacteroidia bacterium]
MPTFLQQLVKEIKEQFPEHTADLHIVFPTRRAGLFFQKEFSALHDKPVWSPVVMSIQDYLLSLSGAVIPDPLTLLFELYEVFKKYFPLEDFDHFYAWGELLLKDFDDLDKYMADASKVFATVTDMHKIDEEFGLPEEDLERLRMFWKNFFEQDLTKLKTEFFNTWKNLHAIYSDFKTSLRTKGLAYEGMAYRDLAMSFSGADNAGKHMAFHTVFAGFYALSPAEERVIKAVLNSGHATAYWDTDSYYVDDEGQEAGKFLRNNPLIRADYKWKEDHFKNIRKEIYFTGVPLMVGQAKYAGEILKELIRSENFIPERTAVVLPDEKLLFPVLYSIPEEIKEINVTMGYPLRQTPLFNLFEELSSLQKNARKERDGNLSFYYRDVRGVLDHNYIRLCGGKKLEKWLHELKENYIRISSVRLFEDAPADLFYILFRRPENVTEIILWVKQILRLILDAFKEQEFRFHRLESEFVFTFFTQVKRLEDILGTLDKPVETTTFWRIFKEVISSVRIPFSGEPLNGLQVMGFLETRVLDFDHVILLSVNEDVLPAGGSSPSFIPFNIRKAFGLPTYEDQHAVSAFHFYRLLQRARTVHLVFNTEARAITAGERSRFLLQLEHELQRKFPQSISIRERIITTPIRQSETVPVIVKKTKEVLSELNRLLGTSEADAKGKLSASALQAYIACTLRFYFRYVAGLNEQEEPEENMEAATFGKVLHKAMQTLYTGVVGVDKAVITGLKKRVEDAVDAAIHEEFVAVDQLEGKNILLRNVICELVNRTLEEDLRYVPFEIRQLEKDVSRRFQFQDNRTVKLFGIIDRVDMKGDLYRIVDYKTGRVDPKKTIRN